MDTQHPAIGILGGLGPYAGLDLMRKIFDQTPASSDQEHLPVIHFSLSHLIADRTAFLLGSASTNPAEAIGSLLVRLAQSGASVIGMPCNTAHSPRILDSALAQLDSSAPKVRFVHMIDAVMAHLAAILPAGCPVGVLSTQGTYATGLYQDALARAGFQALFPDEAGRVCVQDAISHAEYGIKAQSNPVTAQAKAQLSQEAGALVEQGALAVVLGCTEIPLALTESTLHGVPLVDATDVLATALIRAFTQPDLAVAS